MESIVMKQKRVHPSKRKHQACFKVGKSVLQHSVPRIVGQIQSGILFILCKGVVFFFFIIIGVNYIYLLCNVPRDCPVTCLFKIRSDQIISTTAFSQLSFEPKDFYTKIFLFCHDSNKMYI